MEQILASIIESNSKNEVKHTHEDDLGIDIYAKEETKIANRSSSDYDILKEIWEGQDAITLMDMTTARQLMDFREKPIKSALKNSDTLMILVDRHKQNDKE